jgi:2,3-bisphosphoglycerate-independent phosphoglycerate mutase
MLKPVVLVVLDGWGLASSFIGNAIKKASAPTFSILNKNYPFLVLQASGMSVGLPWGTAGNSEVGHMTMGAGRITYQNLPRISLSIDDSSFFQNEALLAAAENVKKNSSKLHLMGLLSSGSVHSHREHLFALLQLAKTQGLTEVYVHVFTDGRDSAPLSGIEQVAELEAYMKKLGVGKIASIAGRHFAMDRNHNWERTKETYTMLTEGAPGNAADAEQYLSTSYQEGFTDEFVVPTNILINEKKVLIENHDSVIFFNFREDRARQLTDAFASKDFSAFERNMLDLCFVTLVEYEEGQNTLVAFPPATAQGTLGAILSKHGKKQIRIAETEKYAHVTYFFNGGNETPSPGEERKLVPSQTTAHFDETPEMSAPEITEAVIEAVSKGIYDFILVNYANPDMVGHTGNEEATMKAIEAVDHGLETLIPKVLEKGGCLIITADHGNAEEMLHAISNEADTEHSTNPVPLWFVTPNNHREKNGEQITREQSQISGLLSDIAPTILDILEVEKPKEMTGSSLLPLYLKNYKVPESTTLTPAVQMSEERLCYQKSKTYTLCRFL